MATTPMEIDDIFNGDIFVMLGMGSMSDAEKAEILNTITRTVYARVFLQVGELLNDADRAVFANLEAEALVPFLAERDIDIHTMLIEESMRYRQELIYTFMSAHNEYLVETPEEKALAAA